MAQRKKPEENSSKVWYLVESSEDIRDSSTELTYASLTLEEAYSAEISGNEITGKKYAFKIELLGEVTQKIEIKKS